MRYFLFSLLLVAVLPVSAQIFVNKIDVNERPIQYVEVWEKFNKGNNKFFVMLDYGQPDDLKDKEGKNLFVTNKEGQYIEFNSIVDALNFMYRNGWEVMHPKAAGSVQSYILRKRTDYVNQSNNVLPADINTTTSVEKASPLVQPGETVEQTAKTTKMEVVQNVEQTTKEAIPKVEVKRLKKAKNSTTEENK